MVIVEVSGGLGNQLQQYALYKKIESMGVDARLDLRWFTPKEQKKAAYKRSLEIDRLSGITYRACTDEERASIIGGDDILSKVIRKLRGAAGSSKTDVSDAQGREAVPTISEKKFVESGIYHPELLSFIKDHPESDLYIKGFFACEYYYADILDDLQQKISFPIDEDEKLSDEPKKAIRDMADKISSDDGTVPVSLHLRRGDYLDEANKALFGGICTDDYYITAINEIRGNDGKKVTVYVFSDDASYSRDYIHMLEKEVFNSAGTSNVTFIPVDVNRGENSLYDIYLMSRCRANICANSTFSFWGARLNPHHDKVMIRPTKHKNTQSFNREDMLKWWKDWTFISPEGLIIKND